MSILPGIYASQITGRLATNSYESIATANGTGSSGTITFSSIPSTYKHLQIRYIARSSLLTSGYPGITINLNGDTSSNYSYHRLYGTGSVGQSDSGANQTNGYIGGATAAQNMANEIAPGIIDILDYTSTSKTKTVRGFWGGDDNTLGAGGTIHLNSVGWFATPAAITSLTLSLGSGQLFQTNSQFALYGIKG